MDLSYDLCASESSTGHTLRTEEKEEHQMLREIKGGSYLLNFLSFLNILAFLLQHLFNTVKPIVNFVYLPTHCIGG